MRFPHSSVCKEYACSAGEPGSVSELGRSSGEGNGSPLQCSCLENPMDRGAWQATVHGSQRVGQDLATKSPPELTIERSYQTHSHNLCLKIRLVRKPS